MTTQSEFETAIWADRKLTTAQKFIGLCIARYADWETGEHSHPGNKLIAEECAMDEKTVRRNLPALIDQGWIVQTYWGRGRKSDKANEYTLSLPGMMSVTHDIQTDIVSVQTDIVSSSNGHDALTPSLLPSLTPSLLEPKGSVGREEKLKIAEGIGESLATHDSSARSSRASKSSARRRVSVPPIAPAPGPQVSQHSYTYWEKDGSWFVFPAAQVKHPAKDAMTVTLSVEEDEFYQTFFRGGLEFNRCRVDFLTDGPEERAEDIEAASIEKVAAEEAAEEEALSYQMISVPDGVKIWFGPVKGATEKVATVNSWKKYRLNIHDGDKIGYVTPEDYKILVETFDRAA
jgi:hypothetical protein